MKKRKPKNKMYFTKETEHWIIQYNNEKSSDVRSKIYSDHIQYPFEKLFENIYNTYKNLYEYINEDYFNLRSECMVFLNSKMHTYSEDRGKGYSYFGTILKRYLIQKNQYEQTNQKKKIEVEYIDDNVVSGYLASEVSDFVSEFVDVYVSYIDSNIHRLFTDKLERQIADAIVDMFRNRENIYLGEKGDKKILYILIRERANLNSNQTLKITGVVNKFKKLYDELYYNYDAYGKLSLSGSYY